MATRPPVLKIPKLVRLPGGYDILVIVMPTKVADREIGEGCLAEWCVDHREIHLRADRKGQSRREDFIHEMEHAMVDWKDYFLGKSEQE